MPDVIIWGASWNAGNALMARAPNWTLLVKPPPQNPTPRPLVIFGCGLRWTLTCTSLRLYCQFHDAVCSKTTILWLLDITEQKYFNDVTLLRLPVMLTRPQPPRPRPRPVPHTWRSKTQPRFHSIYTRQLIYLEVGLIFSLQSSLKISQCFISIVIRLTCN